MGHAIASGLIGGWLATLFLGWAVHSARSVKASRDGWLSLRARTAIWSALGLSAGFALFLMYIYLFVGSARSDAAQQMLYCRILSVAFAIGAVIVAWGAFSKAVSWRGSELRVRPLFGGLVSKRLEDVQAVEYRTGSGMFRLRFSDGYALNVSPYMRGTRQLLDQIGVATGGSG